MSDKNEIDAQRQQLEQKEKDLAEKQRLFDVRMKEQGERFIKDKKDYEARYQEKLKKLELQEKDLKKTNEESEIQKQEWELEKTKIGEDCRNHPDFKKMVDEVSALEEKTRGLEGHL